MHIVSCTFLLRGFIIELALRSPQRTFVRAIDGMDVPEVDESFAEEFLCSIFIMYENKFWPDPPCAICLFVYIYE